MNRNRRGNQSNNWRNNNSRTQHIRQVQAQSNSTDENGHGESNFDEDSGDNGYSEIQKSNGFIAPVYISKDFPSSTLQKVLLTEDSAAQVTVLSKSTCFDLGLEINYKLKPNLVGFDGKVSNKIIGSTRMTVQVQRGIGMKCVEIFPVVLDVPRGSPHGDLLGLDVLSIFPNSKYLYKNKMRFRWDYDGPESVYVSKACVLKPFEDSLVEVKKLSIKSDEIVIQGPDFKSNRTEIPRSIYPASTVKIRVVNPSDKHIKLFEGQRIAKAEPCVEVKPLPTTSGKGIPSREVSEQEFIRLVEKKIAHVEKPYANKLRKLLIEKQKAFDIRNSKIGRYVGDPIDLIENDRIYEKIYTAKPQKRRIFDPKTWEKLKPEIDMLRQHDLIEKSKRVVGPPCNIVCVKRKGSDRVRLCCDFSSTANILVPNCHYPMPSYDEIITNLRPFEVASCIDVSDCYWGFELTERSRELTNFYVKIDGVDDVYRWKRLPFGLKTAGNWCQKIIASEILSRDVRLRLSPEASLQLFVDDGILLSNKSNHLENLSIIMQAFIDSGLQLKFSKCEFFRDEVNFLGFMLKAPGKIVADPKAVECIKNLPLPETVKQLRSFLGVCNHKRAMSDPSEYIKYSSILNKKLRGTKPESSEPISLSEEETEACLGLKRITQNLASLHIPDFDCPQGFAIEADASCQGAGGYIYQRKTGRPIQFFAHSFGVSGSTADNINREAAALIYAITKFSKYIMNSKIPTIVYTDSRVLSFLKTATAPKLIRWRNLVESLPIIIKHKSGSLMHTSDGLSRMIPKDCKNDSKMTPLVNEVLANCNEYVVASSKVLDDNAENASLLLCHHLHTKENHASPDQLFKLYPEAAPLRIWREVGKNCPECVQNTKVKRYNQVYSSTSKSIEKRNQLWYCDLVFPRVGRKLVKKTVLSCVDVVSKYSLFEELPGKDAKYIVKAMDKIFSYVGLPKKIRFDQEKSALSKEVQEFLASKDVEMESLPRKSAWCNRVERCHEIFKGILAKNPKFSIKNAQDQANSMPLLDVPESKFIFSPRDLHFHASEADVEKLVSHLQNQSKKRAQKQLLARGNNHARFERVFTIGDMVKANKLNSTEIQFGRVVDVSGSKVVSFEDVSSGRLVKAHSSDLEKVNFNQDQIKLLLA